MNDVLATVARSFRLPFHLGRGGGWLFAIAAILVIAAIVALVRHRGHDHDTGRNEFRNDRSVHQNSLRTEFAEDDQITEKELQNHLRDQEERHNHDDHF